MCIIALARCLCMMDMCMNDARPDPMPCSALLCTGRQQHTPLSVLPTFSPVPFSPSRRRLVGVSPSTFTHIYPYSSDFIHIHPSISLLSLLPRLSLLSLLSILTFLTLPTFQFLLSSYPIPPILSLLHIHHTPHVSFGYTAARVVLIPSSPGSSLPV